MRTLLVKDGDGEFKVEVPDEATVTFGPTIPYVPKNGYSGANHYSLRVYQGSDKGKLLAVFAGVEWFRDETLSVRRKITQEVGRTIWKSDKDGYSVEEAVQKKAQWEGELARDARQLRLPAKRKTRK